MNHKRSTPLVPTPLLSFNTPKTLAVFGTFLLCAMNLAEAEDAACVKAAVSEGSQCPNPKVEIDLSGCDDSLTGGIQTTCTSSGIKATAKSKSYTYAVAFSGSESWGKKSYAFESASRTELAAASTKSEAIAPAPKKEKPAPKAEAALVPQPLADYGIVFGGTFDVFYNYNFNRPKSVTSPSTLLPEGNVKYRYYDQFHNQFGLNLAELSVKKADGPVQFAVDFDFGEMADYNAYVAVVDGKNTADEVSKHIGQATVTYAPEALDGVAITFGKMYTHIGYEVAKAKDNWQYSRSFTYGFGIPIWHTGLAVTFPMVKDVLSAGLYVYNGWNNLYDNNDGKTYGLQFKLTPVDKFALTYNLITGPEQNNDNGNFRTVNELNLLINFTDDVQGMLEGLFGFEPEGNGTETTKWFGITAHTKAVVNSWLWLSPRFEYFKQMKGTGAGADSFGTGDQAFLSFTWTNGFVIGHGLESRLELRYDGAKDSKVFATKDGTSKHQFTATLAGIYSF